MKRYEVTKYFISGLLKGITYIEKTTVNFHINQIVSKPCGGSPYKIILIKEV
jgi:hypothetical protein